MWITISPIARDCSDDTPPPTKVPPTRQPSPARAGLNDATPQNAAAGFSRVISPTLVNDLRAGFNRLNFLYGLPEVNFSVGGANTALPNFIIGQLNFGGAGPYNGTGSPAASPARATNTYQVWDVVAWQHGRHAMKFGRGVRRVPIRPLRIRRPAGFAHFHLRLHTTPPPPHPRAAIKSGDASASALLGSASAAVRTLGPNRIDGRQQNYAGFAQDDIR
ncbi:MAG: hypothetical protein WDO73_03485 [Ignavibacteriota bacterium]